MVHELGNRADAAGQQAVAEQVKTERRQPVRRRRRVEALGTPGDKLVFMFGADSHRTPHIGAEHRVGHRGLPG